MIELTEEKAKKLLENIIIEECCEEATWHHNVRIDETIDRWKQKGWIKKTALEEAREYANNIYRGYSHYEQDAVRKCSKLYERVIKEIQENK